MFLAPFFFVVLTAVMTDEQAVTPSFIAAPVRVVRTSARSSSGSRSSATPGTRLQIAFLSTVGVVAVVRSPWPTPCADALAGTPGRVPARARDVDAARPGDDRAAVRRCGALHQIGRLKPLILPSFFGDAFSIFLLRQFFMTIPEELSDAARVDGASEFQIMTRVIVPLAKPAIAAVALVQLPLQLERLLRAAAVRGEQPASSGR